MYTNIPLEMDAGTSTGECGIILPVSEAAHILDFLCIRCKRAAIDAGPVPRAFSF